MAKLGEGDERWIVKEREDGANVNNWHWQEKDAFAWSKDRLGNLLRVSVPDDDGVVGLKTTGVTSLTGEAYVNRRKGKIICGYELELKMKYEGVVDGVDVSGNVHFPYIADENVGEEPECVVLASSNAAADEKAKRTIRTHLFPKFFQAVALFEKELAAGGPGGAGDAPPDTKAGATDDPTNDRSADDTATTERSGTKPRADKVAPLSQTKHTIEMTERFYCRPLDICEALTDAGRVMHFSRSPARVSPEKGSAFSMFDGNITGTILEYEPGVKLVQSWRFRNWTEGHHSVVTITFREPEPGNCFVHLKQDDVPETDAFGNESVMDTTEIGWKEQIFDRIRQAFGYGA
jgi:activator of HSP90 ATPase